MGENADLIKLLKEKAATVNKDSKRYIHSGIVLETSRNKLIRACEKETNRLLNRWFINTFVPTSVIAKMAIKNCRIEAKIFYRAIESNKEFGKILDKSIQDWEETNNLINLKYHLKETKNVL